MTAAETFQAWATGAVAITTTVAIVIGGAWALWRYVLPGPFGCAWEWEVPRCSVRLLPSGRYIYMAELIVRNRSSALYTIQRVIAGVYFPNGQAHRELARVELKPPEASEIQGNLRCPPHTRRGIAGSSHEVDTLHHVVVVAWKIEYRGPRLLGLFGQRDDAVKYAKTVPVDAQSLALYVEAGKEEAKA